VTDTEPTGLNTNQIKLQEGGVMRIRLTQATLFLFLVVFFLTNTGLGQQSWPMINGCRERSSWASQEDVLSPPLQQSTWNPSDVSGTMSTLSWYDHLLIVAKQSTPNIFFAVDDSTGDTLWTFSIPSSIGSVNFVAAQNDSMVFLGGQNGLGLYAVYRSTGVEKWFKPIGSLYTRHPVLDGDRLYIVGDSLYCVNIGDGSSAWSYYFDIQVSPAVDDNMCYVCGDQKAMAIDKLTGVKQWEKYNSQYSFTALAVDELFVYTETNDSLVARSKATGEIQWAYRVNNVNLTSQNTNSIAVADSFLCFTVLENLDGKGQIFALCKTDGSYRWDYEFDGSGVYSPVIANDVVYIVSSSDHDLFGFDLLTGAVLLRNTLYFKHQPIVANHKLYVITSSSVVAFENYESAVEDDDALPQGFDLLLENYPNPFNPSTTIKFILPRRASVSLKIYNLLGQEVVQLTEGIYDAGTHFIEWDAHGISSGVYFCRLETHELTGESRHVQKALKIVLQR
jgi:outer membrane protein assembly factor BamB